MGILPAGVSVLLVPLEARRVQWIPGTGVIDRWCECSKPSLPVFSGRTTRALECWAAFPASVCLFIYLFVSETESPCVAQVGLEFAL